MIQNGSGVVLCECGGCDPELVHPVWHCVCVCVQGSGYLWKPRLMQLIPRLYRDRMKPGWISRAREYASTASSLRSPLASVAPRRFHSR